MLRIRPRPPPRTSAPAVATSCYQPRRTDRSCYPVRHVNALLWWDRRTAHTRTEVGHGRITRRAIQVLPAPPDLPFPHACQVLLIERYVAAWPASRSQPSPPDGSPACHRCMPARPDLAGYLQGQGPSSPSLATRHPCTSKTHPRFAPAPGPRITASLLNLAIGALRLAGRHDVTEATRWAGRYLHRAGGRHPHAGAAGLTGASGNPTSAPAASCLESSAQCRWNSGPVMVRPSPCPA